MYWTDRGCVDLVYAPTSAELNSSDLDSYWRFARLQAVDSTDAARLRIFEELKDNDFKDPQFLTMQVFGPGGMAGGVDVGLSQSLGAAVVELPDAHIVNAWIAESLGQTDPRWRPSYGRAPWPGSRNRLGRVRFRGFSDKSRRRIESPCHLLVFGGHHGSQDLFDGSIYDVEADRWSSVDGISDIPSRDSEATHWIGQKYRPFFVWGGQAG